MENQTNMARLQMAIDSLAEARKQMAEIKSLIYSVESVLEYTKQNQPPQNNLLRDPRVLEAMTKHQYAEGLAEEVENAIELEHDSSGDGLTTTISVSVINYKMKYLWSYVIDAVLDGLEEQGYAIIHTGKTEEQSNDTDRD